MEGNLVCLPNMGTVLVTNVLEAKNAKKIHTSNVSNHLALTGENAVNQNLYLLTSSASLIQAIWTTAVQELL